jgi:hypothetical protein
VSILSSYNTIVIASQMSYDIRDPHHYEFKTNLKDPGLYFEHRWMMWNAFNKLRIACMDWDLEYDYIEVML